MVDELRMIESKTVSAINHEASMFLESYYDENDLYHVENMSIDETRENLNDVSMRLNTKVHM